MKHARLTPLALSAALALALALSATAADTEKREVIVPWFAVPAAATVDTIEYAASRGERVYVDGAWVVPTHDNADASPERTFTESDWNDTSKWVDFPVSISVPEYDTTTGEFVRYYNQRINRATSLEKILANEGQPCPPKPWPGYTLYAKSSCSSQGHVYGADCVCLNCGERRDHHFGGSATLSAACVRCDNRFDEYTINSDGFYVKTGNTLDSVCGAPMPADFPVDMSIPEEYHGGFHAEETDSEKYNCSCECGYFAFSAVKLAHDFNSDPDSDWQSTNPNTGETDEVQHWRYALCQRCLKAKTWTAEDHRTAPNATGREDGDSTYIDEDAHAAPGACPDCGYTGEIREAHDTDENCYCRYCNTYCHSWKQINCGTSVLERYTCSVCGTSAYVDAKGKYQTVSDPAALHAFGDPYPEGNSLRPTHHHCFCSAVSQVHEFDRYDICEICGYELESDESSGHRDPNCAKRGIGNNRHSGDKSRNPLTFNCPAIDPAPDPVPPIDPNTFTLADLDDPSATVTVTTNDYANLYAIGLYAVNTPDKNETVVVSGAQIPPIYATRKRDGVEESYPLTPYPKKGAQVMDELASAMADYFNATSGSFIVNLRWNCLPHTYANPFTGKKTTTLLSDRSFYLHGEIKTDSKNKTYIDWQ